MPMPLIQGPHRNTDSHRSSALQSEPCPAFKTRLEVLLSTRDLWKLQPVLIFLCSSRPPPALRVFWWSERGDRALSALHEGHFPSPSLIPGLKGTGTLQGPHITQGVFCMSQVN